jgi:hypothetical protein
MLLFMSGVVDIEVHPSRIGNGPIWRRVGNASKFGTAGMAAVGRRQWSRSMSENVDLVV